jgi:hypothetical protein
MREIYVKNRGKEKEKFEEPGENRESAKEG